MKRSVQFWRFTNGDGTDLAERFPAVAVVRAIADAETACADRHRICGDGMILIAHADRSRIDPMLTLDKVRRDNLPSVGDPAGVRRPIGLTLGEGLLEPTYCAFTQNNVVAMLTNGSGPRPQRLADYLRSKLGLSVGLTPVLTRNLDEVLREMRVTAVDVSIPAQSVNRDLLGGDWVYALEAGQRLSEGGLVRVGFSVGHSGTRAEKASIGARFRERVNQLRGSGALSEFKSARVTGSLNGSTRTVDLLHDKFVEQVDVDADILNDPAQSEDYARGILVREIAAKQEYLLHANPPVSEQSMPFDGRLIETPDDERR